MMRSSALSLALGYVALGIASLVLFAAPLWYAWQVTIQDGRSEILQADAQRLTDVYRRDGGDALKRFIDARVHMQIAGDRILLLTDPSLQPLAGNLSAWPRNRPARPATTASRSTWATRAFRKPWCTSRCSARIIFWSAGTTSSSRRLETAVLVRVGRGHRGALDRRTAGRPDHPPALMSRVHSIRHTVSAIIHGDLKHRLPTAFERR